MKQCERCNRKFPDHMVFCPYDGDILIGEIDDPLLGAILDGKYRIEEKLGQGGMGSVYRAKHILIDNDLAIKVLHSNLVADRHAVARFQREAMAAARIKHTNAVGVTDFGITELENDRNSQIVYIVMELFIGQSLREVLEKQGSISIERGLLIIRQVCHALDAAHRSGVIHRDIKPDNIVIEKDGKGDLVKVLDFGIAKLKDGPTGDTQGRLTRQGVIIGSPHYLSPEQCQNAELDARSDIYSVGVVLYEMFTGDVPFKAPTPIAVAMMHATEQPIPVREKRPDFPPALERVIMGALEKSPDSRPSSALELAHQLEVASTESGINVLPLPGINSFVIQDIQNRQELVNKISGALFKEVKVSQSDDDRDIEVDFPTVNTLSSAQQQTQNSSPERYKEEVDTPSKAPDYTTGSVSFQSGSFNTSTLFNIPPIEPPGTKLKNAYLIMIGVMIGIFLVGSGIILFLKPPEKSSPGSATNAKTTPPSGMVYIEGGTFKMGDDRGESFDAPSHEVTVKPFFIDKMEVTNQDYKKFIDETNSSPPQNWKGYQFPPGTDLKPVTGIDWQQAASYAKWAGKRLPTEIEWEYAARGKDGRAYPWGDDWKEGAAVSKELKVDNPMPKGSIPTGASPFGILDMSGNVSEWTADNFTLYEGNKGKLDQKLKSMKVVRGGSYKSEKKFVTTYSRIPLDPLFKDPSLGFRCVKSIE